MQEMSELAGMINKLKNKQDTVTEHSIVHERERERERECVCVCVCRCFKEKVGEWV